MANTVTSKLTTEFNLDPYYDDYDEDKGFYRVIFRPGYPVQARELTQLQTMLQKQIERFGKHIFRDGSIVLPGAFSIDLGVSYVKINDNDNTNIEVTIKDWENREITGQTTGLKAVVVATEDGSEILTNSKTLYVQYLNSATDTTTKTFSASEILLDANGNSLVVSSTSPVGLGSRFTITDGVFFAKEHFIAFPTSSITLSRYSQNPNCKVGFVVTEELIRYSDDESLLDPALGSSNYSAPGADRLKLKPELAIYSSDSIDDKDFVKLFSITDGIIQESFERSQYNVLRDELAKRTSDESGDYYVRGLGVKVRENYDDGTNFGFSNTGNSALLSVGVEPGIAYVKGYEVGKLTTDWFTINKGTTYENVNSQIITSVHGHSLLLNQVHGILKADEGQIINLMDTAQQVHTNRTWGNTAIGSVIGYGRIKGFEHYEGIASTANAQYKLYLMDINMLGTNIFSSVRSISSNTTYSVNKFLGDVVLNSNKAVLENSASNPMLYYIGSPSTRTVRDNSGLVDTAFTFRRSESVTIPANGSFTVSISAGVEQFPYGTTTLSDAEKKDIMLVLDVSSRTVTLSGTAQIANGSNIVVGAGTTFTYLNAGDRISFAGENAGTPPHVIDSISNNTTLILKNAINTSTYTGNVIYKAYRSGDIFDLTHQGITGTERSVTTTPTTLTLDLKENIGSTSAAIISYKLARSSAREIAKTLKPSRFIKINCASSGTSGPFSLGVSDLYQVRDIRKKTSAFTSMSEGTSVKTNFTINNGQKDTHYDIASIKPKTSLTASDHLLIELDYFAPDFTQGVGYFSIDSYPIDDTITSNTTIRTEDIPVFRSPVSGSKYDLRNYLDYRPVKTITAADSTTVAGATSDPSLNSSTFYVETSGLRLPVSSTQIVYDFSYYLPRRDLVIIDKDGFCSSVEGIPSLNPRTPTMPENSMALASIYIPPYPSLAGDYATLINRKDLAATSKKISNIRYTMRDIGVLKDRIVNLEYYSTLNALERNAYEFRILDENGLDRFKNGIFVDSFTDHTLGAYWDNDYRIVVDKTENSIRPVYTMDSVGYKIVSNTGTVINGPMATLPYTETAWLTQPNRTTIRNTEVATYKFTGKLYLTPETDFWVDTQYLPEQIITFGDETTSESYEGEILGTEWDAWSRRVTGYRVYDRRNTLVASFGATQEAAAETLAAQLSNSSGLSHTVETITNSTRVGIQTSAGSETESETLGDRVVDTSLIPYIKPQNIHLHAKGLKANTKFNVFFDGENLTKFVTPYTPTNATKNLVYSIINSQTAEETTFNPEILGTSYNLSNEGNAFVSDSRGEVFGVLRLPTTIRFRTGTKPVKITDSPTNAIGDETSTAIDYFVAQGLVQQKQGTILSTRSVIDIETSISETITNTSRETFNPVPVNPPQPEINNQWSWWQDRGGRDSPSNACMAYSFLVKAPAGVTGLFMTSADIYIAAKSATYGAWFEIREMNSAGGITRNFVPFSRVWYKSSELTVTQDGTTPFRVKFPSPVFLYNDKQYAFVIHPEAANPNLYLWVSRLGETDIITGKKNTDRAYKGTLYMTNNDLNWNMVPDVDLTVKFNRAVFTANTTGTLIIGNEPVEKLMLGNVTSTLTNYSETMKSDDILTLASITGGSIVVGDHLRTGTFGTPNQNTTNSNVTVSSIISSDYTMSNTGFNIGETVYAYHAANLVYKGVSANISNIQRGTGTLLKTKTVDGNIYVHLKNSSGKFSLGKPLRSASKVPVATIDAIENYRYSIVDFEPSYLNFNGTTIDFSMQTTDLTDTKSSYFKIKDNQNYYLPREMKVVGRTNEIDDFSGSSTNNVKISMFTNTNYVSPVFDVGRSHSIYIDNIINSNTIGETSVSGGGIYNKYISKTITLAEGQDAEDISLILTAYRPPSTDVKVYVKLLHNEDGELMKDKNWIELEKIDSGLYSSLANRDDFKEFVYKIPTTNLTGINGEIQYTTSNGNIFTGYKYFAVKIGLTSTDSTVVPRVADLRVIALQK